MFKTFSKVLRAGERRKIEELASTVEAVNRWEPDIKKLTDDQMVAKTAEFRSRLERGEDLEEMLPEVFALVREAAWRVLGQRHFDVQIMGGIVLHHGKIAEMKTGEGKTLVATLPAYLNGLTGKGVHVVTVNDYLARRDSEWMGSIYRKLGLTVGVIQQQQPKADRRLAYAADITYGTNNEIGFDYLRDNLEVDLRNVVQRGHNYAIVDEVDSILIDEARTPLIISGAAEESAKLYRQFAKIAPRLRKDQDYEVEEKTQSVGISEDGIAKVEQILGMDNLYDHVNTPLVHHLQNAVKAKELFRRDVDYVVKDGEVIIVDEFTGRLMPGRRWSDGLHQAVEAKENLKVREENQTLATITLQNYFRMYDKLAGMTGTAATEADEFLHTYELETVVIPTNQPMVRDDRNDAIYKTEEAKFDAVVKEISECYERGQPVLAGTISIEKSETLSKMLKRQGVPHEVLNAKQHDREAIIVAQAGRLGAITISTNMAGRGTDIMLGGNPELLAREDLAGDPQYSEEEFKEALKACIEQAEREKQEVIEAGGLYVVGTERHESRRIDNQLRGRSGRQGDPGASRFYLSLEDDLMRVFAAKTIGGIMERLHFPEDLPIEHRMVTKAIENAQKNVESNNFETRKNLLKYDDVMNTQREIIYAERRRILEGQNLHDQVEEIIQETVEGAVSIYTNPGTFPEEWDLAGLFRHVEQICPLSFGPDDLEVESLTQEALTAAFAEEAGELYRQREELFARDGNDVRDVERVVMLRVIDNRWREHLYEMDHLRDSVGLRAFAGRDPVVEFQSEAYDTFQEMIAGIKEEFLRYMYHIQMVQQQEERPAVRAVEESGGGKAKPAQQAEAHSEKVGRNAPCPCGSGKKYKFCHGKGL